MKMEVVNDVSRDTHYLGDLTSALKLAWLKPQLCSNRAAGISTHKLATHYSTQAGAGAPGQSKPGKKFELQLRQSSTSEMEGRAIASIRWGSTIYAMQWKSNHGPLVVRNIFSSGNRTFGHDLPSQRRDQGHGGNVGRRDLGGMEQSWVAGAS